MDEHLTCALRQPWCLGVTLGMALQQQMAKRGRGGVGHPGGIFTQWENAFLMKDEINALFVCLFSLWRPWVVYRMEVLHSKRNVTVLLKGCFSKRSGNSELSKEQKLAVP